MTLAQQDMYLNEDTASEKGVKVFPTMAEARSFLNQLEEGEGE